MPCPEGKIKNPATGRCVKLGGAIGKRLSPKRTKAAKQYLEVQVHFPGMTKNDFNTFTEGAMGYLTSGDYGNNWAVRYAAGGYVTYTISWPNRLSQEDKHENRILESMMNYYAFNDHQFVENPFLTRGHLMKQTFKVVDVSVLCQGPNVICYGSFK
jgi:hypothetical protein